MHFQVIMGSNGRECQPWAIIGLNQCNFVEVMQLWRRDINWDQLNHGCNTRREQSSWRPIEHKNQLVSGEKKCNIYETRRDK